MQRFGPPPSYPTLRIPGLNAPLPAGLVLDHLFCRVLTILCSAQWGFHPGGWGKPPMDEYNRPLYGDVFGVLPKASDFQEVSAVSHQNGCLANRSVGWGANRARSLGRTRT